MRYSAAIALAVLPALAAAATTHTVSVGSNSTLTFTPNTTVAAVGDSVKFVFESKNHSVVESSFTAPCTKLNSSSFASEFNPVNSGQAQLPSFTVNVTSTDPIWFYCSQKIPANHCQLGMVGVINAPAGKTIDQFKANAIATANSTNTSSSASPSSAAPSSPTKSSAAMRLNGGSAGLLTLMGVIAGLTL